MTVVSVANQKGGVGKTTTVVNLAAALHAMGFRVLVVDNDPQSNLALALGILDTDSLYPTLGDLLIAGARAQQSVSARDGIVATSSGMDLLPSNVQLSAADLVLVATMGRERVMKNILEPVVDDYDFVVIDCLPSLGLLAINSLTASDGVLIPVQADYLAVQGLAQIMETIAAVREQLNPELQIFGVLLTMVDQRTTHSREVASLVRRSLADQLRVFGAEIRLQVGLKDSVRSGRPMTDYDPESQGAQAYREVAEELVQSLGQAPVARPARVAGRPAPTAPDGAVLSGRNGAAAPVPTAAGGPEEAQGAAVKVGEGVPLEGAASAQLGAAGPAPAVATQGPRPFREFLVGREGWLGSPKT